MPRYGVFFFCSVKKISVESTTGAVAHRLRFQPPLIEPYVRISRIRLSDKTSCLRTRKAALKCSHADQPQGLVQVLIREA